MDNVSPTDPRQWQGTLEEYVAHLERERSVRGAMIGGGDGRPKAKSYSRFRDPRTLCPAHRKDGLPRGLRCKYCHAQWARVDRFIKRLGPALVHQGEAVEYSIKGYLEATGQRYSRGQVGRACTHEGPCDVRESGGRRYCRIRRTEWQRQRRKEREHARQMALLQGPADMRVHR